MRKMTQQETEMIIGGISFLCGLSIASCGLSVLGALASFATLNPLGTAISVGGIYTSCPAMLVACDLD